ncbi:MAG: hypothetical protein JNN15_09215 [Blastocatellia bacterium]|nr:hypothetical protein [Blastocatellia bacterium]
MTIKNVQYDSGRVEELVRQLETFQKKEVKPESSSQASQLQQVADPGREERLSSQFLRSRMSVGSSFRQKELSSLLANSLRDSSPDVLRGYLQNIARASQGIDPARQSQTASSLQKVAQVIDKGTPGQRTIVANPLSQTDKALQAAESTQEEIEPILDTFNNIVGLLEPAIVIDQPVQRLVATATQPITSPVEARQKLSAAGLSKGSIDWMFDKTALRMANLSTDLLKEKVAPLSSSQEIEVAKKISKLSDTQADTFAKATPAQQKELIDFPAETLANKLDQLATTPSDPTPAPITDPTAARAKLTEIGFAGSTVRQIPDTAAVRLVALDADLLKEISLQNATSERAFARKIDGLPQEAFDKLKGLPKAEQTRIAKLTSQQMIEELSKITPPPPPPPPPAAKAEAVFNAVEIVLGRKPGSSAEKAAAAQVIKENLSVREIRDARSKRKDPELLADIYPKNGELKVSGNKKVFWNGYDRIHFAARHLIETFDTADIKSKNGWWPVGTTSEQLDGYLKTIIETYGSQIQLPNAGSTGPGFKYYDFDVPNSNGIKARVGIQSDGRITSFFATSGPNVISVSDSEVQTLLNIARS